MTRGWFSDQVRTDIAARPEEIDQASRRSGFGGFADDRGEEQTLGQFVKRAENAGVFPFAAFGSTPVVSTVRRRHRPCTTQTCGRFYKPVF